jgi:hypothetical protein
MREQCSVSLCSVRVTALLSAPAIKTCNEKDGPKPVPCCS